MKWYEVVLNYLRVLVWPLIAGGVIFYYRRNIANLIDRIKTIRLPGGTQLVVEDQQKSNRNKTDKAVAKTLEQGPNVTKKIREEYEKKLASQKKSSTQQINSLIDQLATKAIEVEFERTYNTIFGSQIALLRMLDSKGLNGGTEKELLIHLALAKRLWPSLQSWTLHQYLSYLISRDLISLDSERNYRITENGTTFLGYITASGYPDNKNL